MSDVTSISDAELIRRAINNVAVTPRSPRAATVPLWARVGDRFSLGSTYAQQLCRIYGFNPEQEVRRS